MPSYYKLLRQGLKHYDFTYKVGLNELQEPFNPDPSCGPGGLYFSEEKDILDWLNLYEDTEWIAPVELCKDSKVVTMKGKLKTNKFSLGPLQTIEDYLVGKELSAVRQNGRLLAYVKEQTPEICLAAVRQNGYLLSEVNEQTPEICLAAVRQNGLALAYVNEQTPEICLEAVRQDGFALRYVKEQTPEICLAAVHQNGDAIIYIRYKTPDIYLATMKQYRVTHAVPAPQPQSSDLAMPSIPRDPLVAE